VFVHEKGSGQASSDGKRVLAACLRIFFSNTLHVLIVFIQEKGTVNKQRRQGDVSVFFSFFSNTPHVLIDASYQVLVHLDKRFQSRRFLEIDQSETRIACGGHVW